MPIVCQFSADILFVILWLGLILRVLKGPRFCLIALLHGSNFCIKLYKEQDEIASWWQLILSGWKSCLAAWFYYLLQLAKKRCQPSPGAALRNKVVSNHGQNQPSLPPSHPPSSLWPSSFKKNFGHWFWRVSHVTLPLFDAATGCASFSCQNYFHVVLGCQCKTIKEWGKLLDLFILRRLKGLFGWERDKGRRLFHPLFFSD